MRQIPDELLASLREDIAHRRISNGIQRLESARPLLHSLDPAQPRAAALLGYVAQWIDIGFANPSYLAELVEKFPASGRGHLPLADYAHLRMAEGLLANYRDENERAIDHFRFLLSIAAEFPDRGTLAVAHFWIGRCHRKEGRYDESYRSTQAAVEIARSLNYPAMAAVMSVLESWINFQKGRHGEAIRILREAHNALAADDDYIVLGNIHSAYGRIARREGKYDQAMEHCGLAIAQYQRRDPQHPSLGRVLANMAFVERLCAQQLRRKIDRDVARRKHDQRAADQSRMEELQDSAFRHLDQSFEIFRANRHRRGEGNVYTIRGALHLDRGELDKAEDVGRLAYELGEEKKDRILMARGRILQCMVENAKVEEGIFDHNPDQHARLAFQYAMEALESARLTENQRLLARAYIWQGLTLCNDLFYNPDAARDCCDKAAALVKPEAHDYLWDDLQALRARMTGEGAVDRKLREWSQGQVHGRTFQQVEEEFAELVIPKVWEREDRKISRVAEKLSMSPKKVRRILSHLGLLDAARGDDPGDREGSD